MQLKAVTGGGGVGWGMKTFPCLYPSGLGLIKKLIAKRDLQDSEIIF